MIGQTVSHYRVLEKIGEGGMGQVYLAEDTSLERKVALKFLPEYLPAEDVAHKRFLREAKSAAAIDHPYICNIHEVAQTDDGQDFIVMEYVQGQTLKDRLEQGRLPIKEALQIGSEVAEALEEAHSNGVIHRDLKPSNIMVTPSGHAKVLDFGLAKRVTRDKEDLTSVLTREGTTLGTLAYMSPEQLRGSPVDARADVFSLGVVLYEMLTGLHPFRTGTQAETVNAILSEHPSTLTRYVEGVPDLLQHTIKKMLAKQPGERYQSVHEIRTNLTKVMEEITSPTPLAEPEKKRGVWIGALAVLLGVIAVLVAVVFWPGLDKVAQGPSEPFQLRPLTTDGLFKEGPKLSPDGEHVVYRVDSEPGNQDIFVKSVGEGTKPLQLTDGPEWEGSPVWSPDGKQFAFIRRTGGEAAIYTMPAPFGGQERRVSTGRYSALSWSPDGQWLAVSEQPNQDQPSKIVLISPETNEKKPLTDPPAEIRGDSLPRFSPDGMNVAFARSLTWSNNDYWMQSLKGGDPRRLTSENYFLTVSDTSWTPDSRELIFATGVGYSTRSLFRVSIDRGKPQPVAGIGMGVGDISVRATRLVFVQRVSEMSDIWRIPGPEAEKKGDPELIISGNPAFSDEMMRVSPDGEKIAFLSSRTNAYEIWLANADGSEPVQLTRFRRASSNPTWSPDSRRIVFQSNVEGNMDLYIAEIDGGTPERLTRSPSDDQYPFWSHEGRSIYFISYRSGTPQIWRIGVKGGEATKITRYGAGYPIESANGEYLYYSLKEQGSNLRTIWRVSTEGGEETEYLQEAGYQSRAFDLQKNRLFYVKGQPGRWFAIHYLDLTTGKNVEFFRREEPVSLFDMAVSPNGRWVYYASRPTVETTDLWLVENFQ